MYARIVSARFQSGKVEEVVRIYREAVIPAAQQQKGFRGALLFTDVDGSKGVSVTLWETEGDLISGQTSGYYQEQIAKFGSLLEGSPAQEGYELSASVQVHV